jgi:hypothetical protein
MIFIGVNLSNTKSNEYVFNIKLPVFSNLLAVLTVPKHDMNEHHKTQHFILSLVHSKLI